MKRTALTETAVRQLAAYGLSADALTNCAVQNYHVGEYIMRQGVENSNFFIVLSGISKVCVDAPNGKNLILCYYVTQGVMGDVALMLDRFIATTSVIAVSDFSCIAIPFFENADRLRSNLTFVNAVGQALAQKLLRRGEEHMASALLTGEARLCAFLQMAQRNGVFREPLSDTAQSVAVSYRHVFRIMNKLCAQGILEKTEEGFRILDPEALRRRSIPD